MLHISTAKNLCVKITQCFIGAMMIHTRITHFSLVMCVCMYLLIIADYVIRVQRLQLNPKRSHSNSMLHIHVWTPAAIKHRACGTTPLGSDDVVFSLPPGRCYIYCFLELHIPVWRWMRSGGGAAGAGCSLCRWSRKQPAGAGPPRSPSP